MRRPPHLLASRAPRSGPRTRSAVGGAPLVLPPWLDALSDRWWGLPPRTRTIAAACLAVTLLSGAALRTAASPYGTPVAVLVAAEDLPAGAELDAGAFQHTRWPGELVPGGYRVDPTGTLTVPLPAGAILTDAHVTDRGLGGLLAATDSAVPLPAELVPPLPVGTVVQVVATGVDGAGTVLADRAEVIAGDGGSLWLAVPHAAAADVAAAGLRGSVALAVRSSG